ncbi:MFS transporter [Streptomyces sp. NBC_00539]|uniref:MFS transporter n=1 Tax=Streptomyces sp. NBC_00539 TaxID=2975770 RepID=UPI002E81498B|nr:MFS transporter [Streptomyces sp. NBC_00539]WUC63045.1 MFS transporter [Streptomyces sp. NBC_00539]
MTPRPSELQEAGIPSVTYREVLTSRNVPQLLLAACLSRLAHGMLLFVVVLYAIAEFGSAEVAGLSSAFLTLPGFLVSPIAGAVLDRFGALRAVAMDTTASAVLVGGVAVFSVLDRLTPAVLYVMLGLFSITSPLTDGGIRTLFPQFVPDAAYDRANALDLSTYSVIEVGGPLVAGALFALSGANPALLTVAAMYALAALSLSLLRGGTAKAGADRGVARDPEEPEQHLLRSAWEGITYLLRNPTLRGLAASYAVFQVAYGMLVIIVPVAVGGHVADEASSSRYVGVIWAVLGLAGGTGALLAGKYVRAGLERRFMVGALVLSALAVYPVSALGSLVALGTGLALFGVMEGTVNVSLMSLRLRRTEPERLGRVMTVSISVNLIGFPVGTSLGGVVVDNGSPARALAIAAALALAAAVCARLLVPKEG